MEVPVGGEPLDPLPRVFEQRLVEAIGDCRVKGAAAALGGFVAAGRRGPAAVRPRPATEPCRCLAALRQRGGQDVPVHSLSQQLVDRLAQLDDELARHLAA
jgi:hypothetical protein